MKSTIQQRLPAAVAVVLSVFGLPADAALLSIEIQGTVNSVDGDTSLLPFPASLGQSMSMRYTSSVEAPADLSGGDPTTGYYLGALSSMVLTVGDRSYAITNPFEASSLVQIHDNLTFDGIYYRDGYLARYSNPGAQPADLDADVQLWADTLGPGDALASKAYLSAPPSLDLFPTAVMNFYGRSESQLGVFGVVRGSITSIISAPVPSVPEPSMVWLLLSGLAVLAVASRRGRRGQGAAMV